MEIDLDVVRTIAAVAGVNFTGGKRVVREVIIAAARRQEERDITVWIGGGPAMPIRVDLRRVRTSLSPTARADQARAGRE